MVWLRRSLSRLRAISRAGLRPGWWRRLVSALLVLFYLFFVIGSLQTRGLFNYMGSDYLSFRCSAEIALASGFDQVYNLDRQEECQRPLHDAFALRSFDEVFATVPTPYMPAFVLLFLPLLLLPPLASFLLWTALNAILLVLYLRRFSARVGAVLDGDLWAAMLLCGPFFGVWFFGQVSVWMVICLGEFVLASLQEREFAGGLWLAGLLLKPQALILFVPALVIRRRFRALAGFAAAGTAVLALSFLLAGGGGLRSLAELLLGYSTGLPSNVPYVMMNWRALAVHLDLWIPSAAAWGLAWAGLAATAAVGLLLWYRPAPPASGRFGMALLGTYAATCAVAWHSHVNMALPTVLLLLLLYSRGELSRAMFDTWLYLPAWVFPLAFFTVPGIAHNLVGLSLFLLNLFCVAWAARAVGFPLRRSGDSSESSRAV